MKNSLLKLLLISGTVLTLVSCASRKYGCPATAKAAQEMVVHHNA